MIQHSKPKKGAYDLIYPTLTSHPNKSWEDLTLEHQIIPSLFVSSMLNQMMREPMAEGDEGQGKTLELMPHPLLMANHLVIALAPNPPQLLLFPLFPLFLLPLFLQLLIPLLLLAKLLLLAL